jgi:hypothetical protein
MPTHVSPVQRLAVLAAALEAVARAAADADADGLSACESPLAAAAAALPAPADMVGVNATAVRREMQRIQFALARCRAIGRATTEMIVTTLAAQGKAPGYLPAGVAAPTPRIPGRVEVRA